MPYRLRMSLHNPGHRPRRIVIYGGSVFEVQDPVSHVQNLVAIDNTQVTIGPGGSQVVEIDTWCLNRPFAPPKNTPMRPTVLKSAAERVIDGGVPKLRTT